MSRILLGWVCWQHRGMTICALWRQTCELQESKMLLFFVIKGTFWGFCFIPKGVLVTQTGTPMPLMVAYAYSCMSLLSCFFKILKGKVMVRFRLMKGGIHFQFFTLSSDKIVTIPDDFFFSVISCKTNIMARFSSYKLPDFLTRRMVWNMTFFD